MADSGTELFANYDSDYQVTVADIKQKLTQLQDASDSQRQSILSAIERAVDEGYEIIDQMNLEVQNISSASRASFNAKIRGYRLELDKYKKEVKSIEEEEDRRRLFGSRYADSPDAAESQRKQLLSANSALERSSERLRDSQRVASETEAIGANILTDLRGQREQILNSRNTLSEADSYVDKSIRTLKAMTRRMATNKIISYAIIAVLIILILIVIASKFT